jgi:hypothetical protein
MSIRRTLSVDALRSGRRWLSGLASGLALYPKYKIAKSKPAEHGLPFSTWSLAKLADFLVAEGVVDDISHEGLRVLLRKEGVSFQRIKTWKTSRDPDYAAKKARVEHLYAIADGEVIPEDGEPEVVLCLDEFGPLNLQPHSGQQWAQRSTSSPLAPTEAPPSPARDHHVARRPKAPWAPGPYTPPIDAVLKSVCHMSVSGRRANSKRADGPSPSTQAIGRVGTRAGTRIGSTGASKAKAQAPKSPKLPAFGAATTASCTSAVATSRSGERSVVRGVGGSRRSSSVSPVTGPPTPPWTDRPREREAVSNGRSSVGSHDSVCQAPERAVLVHETDQLHQAVPGRV